MHHRNKIYPKNIESPFKPDEIFFSTTNLKGIILAGNSIFYRTSKYSKDELIGSPHNIIRHPDMPRIVFKLLWDYIKSGRPIVAYVKNMAKDGSYYWVLATVMPVKDDKGIAKKYLSIRIKPTTEYLDLVGRLYKELLEEEKKGGMEASYRKLLEELNKYGYADYDQFMADILSKELESKKDVLKVEEIEGFIDGTEFSKIVRSIFNLAKRLDNTYSSIYGKINTFNNFSHILEEKSENIFRLTDYIRLISLNSSVESFKLGSKGASFSVLSAEMRKNSEMGNRIINEMKGLTTKIMEKIEHMVVLINISRLQVIAITKFIREVLEDLKKGNFNSEEEQEFQINVQDLLQLLKNYSDDVVQYSGDIMELLNDIDDYMKKLKILIKRLEFLYLNGMVESAHHTETSFSIIFTEVNKLVESTRDVLTSLHTPLFDVIQKNKELKNEFKEVDTIVKKMYYHLSQIAERVAG
ncbi:methyl-accepting chemotaxis protein [Persephonella atlantica]|uniref:Methyl-accepting chemotaxis protein n=1 Tax=Persephonella atlantica TaxID=2699429 RepID=A0ABS1GI24_9AQUI|nr:PAS domain-containing methyl-accepting chemotaxis protein [Persephonella atlantica]MBK3332588.1 methyl-accepting chemotaxis protein [Persephonella atlantica]